MSGTRIVLALILLLIVLPFTPQIPGCVAAHRSKAGRVVDVETGKGLPDAFVIASARFISDPVFFGPAGNNVIYDVIVRTNKQGSFIIPSTWSDIAIGIPWTHARIKWIVTVFEPGYAVVGDESAWEYQNAYGLPRFLPRSSAVTPELSGMQWVFGNLGTIDMFRPILTLKQAASYYGTIRGASHPMLGSTDPIVIALRIRGYDHFAPWVCSIEPNSDLEYITAAGIYGFAKDELSAMSLFKEITSDSYLIAIQLRPKYKASAICEVMTRGAHAP